MPKRIRNLALAEAVPAGMAETFCAQLMNDASPPPPPGVLQGQVH